MSVVMLLYVAALFFVLTPGVLVSLPPKAGKLTVAVTHAVVFVVVYQLTNKFVSQALEGFTGGPGQTGRHCNYSQQCAGHCITATKKCS